MCKCTNTEWYFIHLVSIGWSLNFRWIWIKFFFIKTSNFGISIYPLNFLCEEVKIERLTSLKKKTLRDLLIFQIAYEFFKFILRFLRLKNRNKVTNCRYTYIKRFHITLEKVSTYWTNNFTVKGLNFVLKRYFKNIKLKKVTWILKNQ